MKEDKFIKEIREVCQKFNLKPLEVLGQRNYVVRAKTQDGKTVIVKTSHLGDEASILKIIHNSSTYHLQKTVLVPKTIKVSKQYLIQEDFGSDRPILSVQQRNKEKFQQVLRGVAEVHRIFQIEKKRLLPFVKRIDESQGSNHYQTKNWLQGRVSGWQTIKESKKQWLLHPKIVQKIIDSLEKLPLKPLVINFGAASAEHIRIYFQNKVGFFDFGRHLRWAPQEYDAAYLWWGLLRDSVFLNQSTDKNEFILLAELIYKTYKSFDSKTEKNSFWGCILERLSGISKDLSSLEERPYLKKKNIDWLRKLQLELINLVLTKNI